MSASLHSTIRNRSFAVLVAAMVIASAILGWSFNRQQSEQNAAIKEAEFWREIVENTNDAVVVLDHDGIIRHFNPRAEKLYGVQSEEVIGYGIAWMMPRRRWETHKSAFEAAFATADSDSISEVQCFTLTSQGDLIYVTVRTRLVYNRAWYAVAQIVPESDVRRSVLEDQDDPPVLSDEGRVVDENKVPSGTK